MTKRVNTWRYIASTAVFSGCLLIPWASAYAQDAGMIPCPSGAVGCSQASVTYEHREGIPIEFEIDTNWVPANSPVQVRFHTGLLGHTQVNAAGVLQGAWPTAMQLSAHGSPGTGHVESDYGIVLDARIRLHLDIGTTIDWEGNIPYIPMVDFRTTAQSDFDPWAWDPITIQGITARQRIADVPITDLIISIPGISGGLQFDLAAELVTTYRSTEITFGTDAPPINAMTPIVQGLFNFGPHVDYYPQLHGRVDQTIRLHVYPSLYIELAGRRWNVNLFDLPVNIGPFGMAWNFDPSLAQLPLPDVDRRTDVVDFGQVVIGTQVDRQVNFRSTGEMPLTVFAPPQNDTLLWPQSQATIAQGTFGGIPVTFAPTEIGHFEYRLPFQTNDPDTPQVWVTLRGDGIEPVDAGMPDSGPMMTDSGNRDAQETSTTDVVITDQSLPTTDTAPSDAGADATVDPNAIRSPGCGCSTPAQNDSRSGNHTVLIGLFALATAIQLHRSRRREQS